MCYHEDLCVGCCEYALLYLHLNAGWGCCCVMSVRTSKGNCSSWGSRTERSVDVGDSVQYRSGVLPEVRESKRGRRSWKGQGGRTGVEEGWVWEGKVETKHWVRGKRRTLQDIRLDIDLQRKGWRDGQNKGKGTHRDPGGSWKVVQDWEWLRERGYYCPHCNSPAPPGTAQTPLGHQQSLLRPLQT